MKKRINEKYIAYLVLLCIVALQLVYLTYQFVYEKKDYHSDEIWSYELANRAEGPYIYIDVDNSGQTDNYNEWVSGEELRNSVTVQENERFDYANVYDNLRYDMHPPLYFMVLHTVCSMFPNVYSLWFAFCLNLIFFAIGQICLYKAIKNLSNSDIVSIAGCILWGTSVAAASVTLFIRLYGMSAMFSIILLYYYSRMMKNKEFLVKKDFLPIAVVTFLGMVTNNFFTVYAFFMTGGVCFYFLFRKKWKQLVVFALMILLAVGLMLACQPRTLEKASSRVEYSTTEAVRKVPYDYQFISCCFYSMKEVFGIEAPVYPPTYVLDFVECCAMVLIILIPLCVLFRNERWFRGLLKKFIIIVKKVVLVLNGKVKDFSVLLLVMFGAILGVIMLVAYMIEIPLMGVFTNRYLSVIFPIMVAFTVGTLYKFGCLFCRKKHYKIVAGGILIGCLLSVIWNNLWFVSPYVFAGEPKNEGYYTQEEVNDLLNGTDCVLGYTGKWYLVMAPNYARAVDNFFAIDMFNIDGLKESADDSEKEHIEEIRSNINQWSNDKKVYFITDYREASEVLKGLEVLVDEELEADEVKMEDIENFIKTLDCCDEYTYIGYFFSFGRIYKIYQIHS